MVSNDIHLTVADFSLVAWLNESFMDFFVIGLAHIVCQQSEPNLDRIAVNTHLRDTVSFQDRNGHTFANHNRMTSDCIADVDMNKDEANAGHD